MLLKTVVIVAVEFTVQRMTVGAVSRHAHVAEIRSAQPILQRLPTVGAGERIASYAAAKVLAIRPLQPEERLFVSIPALFAGIRLVVK